MRAHVRQFIRNLPIRRKIMAITMITSAAALLLAGAGIVISDSFLFRGYLERDLSALATITADNSTAALAFEDPDAASQILHALQARPHMASACIYRLNGTILAAYMRPDYAGNCPVTEPQSRVRFTSGSLTLSHPVMLRGRRIGSLTMEYDLGEIFERMKLYGVTVLLMLAASATIAFVLSSQLRVIVATPLAQLLEAATAVARTGDYSIRAPRVSDDELGVLVDAVNGMLETIQARDRELMQALLSREEALRESRNAREKLSQANADLARSNENLARSNEDLERFAFIASHDLQEPLRMITLFSQLLIRTLPEPVSPEASGYADTIVGSAKRMRNLLSDLLAYTEIGAPAVESPEPVDMNVVLNQALENLKPAIEASQAQISSDPLPCMRVQQSHFVSLFQNLISNALKYRSEKTPEIRIRCEPRNEFVQFSVADNGMGIDPEYHAKIFVPFRRLHGLNIAGSGIGLAICQRVVDRYGGEIRVESQAGQGANFVFTLPKQLLAQEMAQ
jgi:signal transduction histidine kinase